MQVIMFDRQSIFIHGMKVGLQQRIPEINIHSTCQAEQLWQLLTAHPQALLMLDGDLNSEFLLLVAPGEAAAFFRMPKVLLVVSDDNKSWLQRALAWNVRAIAQREDSADMFAQIINSIMLGMMCLPGTRLMTSAERGKHAVHLSRRQQEIFKTAGGRQL